MSQAMDISRYDLVVFDCDGVLWQGHTPIEGAIDTLSRLRSLNKRIVFVTNNSRMDGEALGAKLTKLGFGQFVREGALWSSVTATGHFLRNSSLRAAFVIGAAGLKKAVAEAGIEVAHPVVSDTERDAGPEDVAHMAVDEAVDAVVVGFDQKLSYFHIACAHYSQHTLTALRARDHPSHVHSDKLGCARRCGPVPTGERGVQIHRHQPGLPISDRRQEAARHALVPRHPPE